MGVSSRQLSRAGIFFASILAVARGYLSYYGNYQSRSPYGRYPSRVGYRTYRNSDVGRRGFWCSYLVNKNVSCMVSYLDRVIEKYHYDCTKYNTKRKYCLGYRTNFVTRYRVDYKLQPTMVKECCPGFSGSFCDKECFNCTTILNLVKELDTLKRNQKTLAQLQVQRGKSYSPASDFHNVGTKGEKGEPGVTGVAGPIGRPGAVGPQGPRGAIGPRGFKGSQGEPGTPGKPGSSGKKGETGEPGKPGPPGPPGYMIQVSPETDFREQKSEKRDIVIGPKGQKGEQGIAGPKGIKGDKGLSEHCPPGPRGPTGPPGASVRGPPGKEGPKGKAGEPGKPGPPGISVNARTQAGQKGVDGLPGIKGDPGVKGRKGDKGERGQQGIPGIPGSLTAELRKEIDDLKKRITFIEKHCPCASADNNPENFFKIN